MLDRRGIFGQLLIFISIAIFGAILPATDVSAKTVANTSDLDAPNILTGIGGMRYKINSPSPNDITVSDTEVRLIVSMTLDWTVPECMPIGDGSNCYLSETYNVTNPIVYKKTSGNAYAVSQKIANCDYELSSQLDPTAQTVTFGGFGGGIQCVDASSLTSRSWNFTNNGTTVSTLNDAALNDPATYTATTNCSSLTNVAAKTKCESVKACIVDSNKSGDGCISSYNTCVEGRIDEQAVLTDCGGQVAKGELSAKTTIPVGGGTEVAPTCTVEAVGWLVCPVTNFLAKIVDGAYGLVEHLLVFSGFTSAENGSMRSAWEGMRNIANIFFVIGFLIIVFSQITSIGISNYGIKKLLPKLIVTAILVNLSYTLCAIAVDASNLFGSSIKDLFTGFTFDTKPQSIAATGEGWAGIAGGILAGTVAVGAALYVGLSALLPALIAAIVSIVTAFLVLTLRQALIILLVVISPLAIVAMLLPNTENWFKKWKSTFMTMLLIYPIIGLLFGASALASKIITSSATGDAQLFIQIMGALVAILPLALTPILLKASGGILGKFGAIVNNPNKGPFDRMRKGAERVRKDAEGRRSIRALTPGSRRVFGAGRFRRQSKREAVSEGIAREQANAQKGYIASQVTSNPSFANRVAGGGRGPLSQANDEAIARALRNAQYTIDKAEIEEVQAASVELKGETVSSIVQRAITGQGVDASGNTFKLTQAQHMAAIDTAMSKGGFSDRRKMVEASSQFDASTDAGKKALQRIADGVYAKGDQGIYGVGIGDKILSGTMDSEGLRAETQQNILDGNMDGKHMVHSQSATKYVVDIAKGQIDGGAAPYSGSVTPDARTEQIVRDAVASAATGEDTKTTASGKAYQDQFNRL